MLATCVSCNRKFETTELMAALVRAGKIESLCAACDGDTDDHAYPPEQEDRDEEKRHGL